MKTTYYLGIDLGTSSVKGILRGSDGSSYRAKSAYESRDPSGWRAAIVRMLHSFPTDARAATQAISFSSQVGTYVVDGREVIGWQSPAGREELQEIKEKISQEEFIREIGMPHPDIISYPLPRLLYIQRHCPDAREVLMPKEFFLRELTGECVTDVFSMRGIADPNTGKYAKTLLERLGITLPLPPVKRPTDRAGLLTRTAAEVYGLPVGTPVYLGCNDFFAGLLGMGVYDENTAFDLSGTSEHVGFISPALLPDGVVSGPYFNGFCSYGGTKSSGVSCAFAMKHFGVEGLALGPSLERNPPLFLPYLNGERAPIFDENARGVYFGIGEATEQRDLAYATLEGVALSLRDIAEAMGMPHPDRLIVGGGSAVDPLMNALRAELFGCPVRCVRENDTSALGAVMLAMLGDGLYANAREAIDACVEYAEPILPTGRYTEILDGRFLLYRKLYRDLKDSFVLFNKRR